ncbi:hypothetical protein N480_03520 [Pseudoalteromonas luteoviolacea S2607]|nr:hypothetical protein N480_03520 [Pseudoalteromonas luteoviolacea S2607]
MEVLGPLNLGKNVQSWPQYGLTLYIEGMFTLA